MKAIVFTFLASFFSVHASSVLWNSEDFSIDGYYGNGKWHYSLRYFHNHVARGFRNSLMTMVLEQNNENGSWMLSGTNVDLGAESTLIVASLGDEISFETTSDESRVLISNRATPEPWPATIIYDGDQSQSLYFGYKSYDDPSYYGWIELIAENETLRLGNTCLDLTGRPVVVGVRSAEPVPEPASGALALLGATILFRRKRGRGKCRPSRSDLRLIAPRWALPPASSRR